MTNISGSSSDGVTIIDLPSSPTSISASGIDKAAVINIAYLSTDFVSGIEVRYKTDGYPASPTDGSGTTFDGAPESVTVNGLTNGKTYYFRLYLYREVYGVKYYQTSTENALASAFVNAVFVTGIEPVEIGENYIVIDKSGNFTLTAHTPVTVFTVGGGCDGGYGDDGYVEDIDDDGDGEVDRFMGRTGDYGGAAGYGGYVCSDTINPNGTLNCISSIGSAGSRTETSLKIGDTLFSSNNGAVIGNKPGLTGYNTPYGYVGSNGGEGGGSVRGNRNVNPGSGAGRGGSYGKPNGHPGQDATTYGSGGGGGGAGNDGGGDGGIGGKGKQGCAIFCWGI